jgi:hypothetical protein
LARTKGKVETAPHTSSAGQFIAAAAFKDMTANTPYVTYFSDNKEAVKIATERLRNGSTKTKFKLHENGL